MDPPVGSIHPPSCHRGPVVGFVGPGVPALAVPSKNQAITGMFDALEDELRVVCVQSGAQESSPVNGCNAAQCCAYIVERVGLCHEVCGGAAAKEVPRKVIDASGFVRLLTNLHIWRSTVRSSA